MGLRYICSSFSIYYLMIDQERQSGNRVQFLQFDISLRMCSEDMLSIAVENTHSFEKYSRTIDHEYISQQENFFQTVFERVQDIYDYLTASIHEIVIEGEILFFDYEYGKNKVRRISIQLVKEEVDRVELAHLKVERMEKHFTTQLLQKDVELKEMRQKYEDIAQQLQKCTTKMQQLSNELQIEKDRSRDLAQKLAPLVPIVQGLQKLEEEAKLFQNIDHHRNNSHKAYFTMTNSTGTSARIHRIGENGYYNFVNKCEILPNQKTKYSVTFVKTKNQDILVGFCTERGLGNPGNHKHVESAYSSCYNGGYLDESGLGKLIDVVYNAGETVECVADLANSKLSWWKKGNQFAQCSVPVEMKNKPIYISIIMFLSGDVVDLCV